MAEKVGDAYVRIYGDGSSISRDVRKALEDTDVTTAGGKKGEQFGEAFDKRLETFLRRNESKIRDQLGSSLTLKAKQTDRIQSVLDSQLFDYIETEIKKRGYGEELSRQIRQGFEDDAKTGRIDLDSLLNFRDVQGTLKSLDKTFGDFNDRVLRAEKEINIERTRSYDNLHRLTERASRDATSLLEGFDDLNLSTHDSADNLRRLAGEYDSFHEKSGRVDRDFVNQSKNLRDLANRVEKVHPGLRRLSNSIDLFADSSGRAFGRGSRNDFVNLTGAVIGGSVRMLKVLPRLAENALNVGKTFSTAFSQGTGLFDSLTKGVSSLIPTIGTGLVSVAALGAGFAVLIAVLGPLVSILSLAAGAITALAASITFAALGAIGALAGLVAPLAVGLGVLVAGIVSMDDATKKALSNSIKPFTTEMRALGKIASTNLFAKAPEQAKALGTAFKGLDKLVGDTATALSDVADIFIEKLNGDSFDDFIDAMEKFIPDAIRSLGRISADTFGGIGGLIVALIPITNRFLKYLEDLSERFNKFTNSAEGRKSLEDFFERAGNSARSFGDFLGSLKNLIAEVFDAGADSGDNIFDSMTKNIEKFTRYLKDNPNALRDWFGDAEEFAQKIGRLAVGFGKFLDILDSPTARSLANGIFVALAVSLDQLGVAFRLVDGIMKGFVFVLGSVADTARGAAGLIVEAFAGLIDGLIFVNNGINKLLPKKLEIDSSGLQSASDNLHGLADRLADPIFDKTLKPKVDSSDFKKAEEYANTTDQSLRKLLGLPPIKPKVETGSLTTGKTATDELIARAEKAAGLPEIKLRVNKVQADNAKLSALLLEKQYYDTAGIVNKKLSMKIDSASARVARNVTADLDRFLRNLPLRKTINVVTHYTNTGNPNGRGGPTATAAGGIFGDSLKRMAVGGLANSAQVRLIGEAGREAVVPLDRPLDQVDPAVRALSAFARGLVPVDQAGRGGPTIDASGWTIMTPTEDPRQAAVEVVNRLVAVGY